MRTFQNKSKARRLLMQTAGLLLWSSGVFVGPE